jgi:hypothetical protein
MLVAHLDDDLDDDADWCADADLPRAIFTRCRHRHLGARA